MECNMECSGDVGCRGQSGHSDINDSRDSKL